MCETTFVHDYSFHQKYIASSATLVRREASKQQALLIVPYCCGTMKRDRHHIKNRPTSHFSFVTRGIFFLVGLVTIHFSLLCQGLNQGLNWRASPNIRPSDLSFITPYPNLTKSTTSFVLWQSWPDSSPIYTPRTMYCGSIRAKSTISTQDWPQQISCSFTRS